MTEREIIKELRDALYAAYIFYLDGNATEALVARADSFLAQRQPPVYTAADMIVARREAFVLGGIDEAKYVGAPEGGYERERLKVEAARRWPDEPSGAGQRQTLDNIQGTA